MSIASVACKVADGPICGYFVAPIAVRWVGRLRHQVVATKRHPGLRACSQDFSSHTLRVPSIVQHQGASAFQGFLGVEDTWYVSHSSCLNNCTWVQCHILVPRVSDCGSLMSYCSCTLIRSFNAMGFHCLLLLLSGWHQLCVGGMCHFTCHKIFAYVHV